MAIKEKQAEEKRRVIRLVKWAARDLSEMPINISFLEQWDGSLKRSHLHYDGRALSYQDERLSFKIDRNGLSMAASFQRRERQKKKKVSVYRKYASVLSFGILGTLSVPVIGYVIKEAFQAEEKRMHLNACQALKQRQTDLDSLYYRDREISPQEYKKECEKLEKAVVKHAQYWSDLCPHAKENVKE